MTVPSYDDLTPGIPDVVDAETAASLASLLRDDVRSQLSASIVPLPAARCQLPASGLYACLRLEAGSGKLEADSRKPEADSGQPTAGSWQRAAVLAVARDFSPRVKQVSDGEVLLDVSGLGRLIGPPDEIRRQLARAIAESGVAASVALGSTQTIARLLACAETANGPTLRPASARGQHSAGYGEVSPERLRREGPWLQLPVDFLQELETLPPAMNHRDRARPYETLQRWGIATLGALAALPAAELSSRLGRRGVALQRLARGLDPAPFVPDGETPRFVGRLELEWPIDALEPLSFVFARLLDPLSAALERADRGAAAIRLELRLTDRSTHARVLQLPAPMRDPRVLRTLLLLDLESAAVTAAVDIVSIELDPAPARITQFSLLRRALPSPETLSTLTARLSALVGESRVGAAVLLDTHEPAAFDMARFAPVSAPSLRRGRPAAPSDAVVRHQRMPVAIRVSVERGRPVHLASSKRGIPCGAIVQAAGPWRLSGGWWTTPRTRDAGHGAGERGGGWNRDEWDVALKSGAVCRIYRDRTTERWFLEGVYD